jgi:DNA-binding transcriptional regulator YbjK
VAAPPKDRRTRIAEAAIDVLARQGARGLTHRAVDASLGLPAGSTSYYFSTRSALLLAAAERLLDLDKADVEAIGMAKGGGAVALVQHWLSPARRTRALARMELLLTSARDPAFRFMRKARKAFVQRVAGSGSEEAQVAATGMITLVDGLILHGLIVGEPSRDALRRLLDRMRPARKAAPRRRAGAAPRARVNADAKRPARS